MKSKAPFGSKPTNNMDVKLLGLGLYLKLYAYYSFFKFFNNLNHILSENVKTVLQILSINMAIEYEFIIIVK